MISESYACAYKEVIEILKYTKEEDVNKIPKYNILLWKTNMKKDHKFKVDTNKSLEEQNLSNEAKAIIANIFKKYWATDYQNKRIEEKERYDLEQAEKEKFEKYNPNELFKKQKESITEEKIEDVSMVEYKEETIFQKLINKIKTFFKSIKK